jgi:hypothetical protein
LIAATPDKTLASCDPAAEQPREVLNWQEKLAAASIKDEAYAKALADELQGLVCTNDTNAIHILRGLGLDRLEETGPNVPALVESVMRKDCPVSASLTDDDKAKLLNIKQDAEKKFPPPPVPKK